MKQQLLCMLTSEAWKCKFSSEIQLCHYGQNLQITLHTGMFYTKHEKVGFFTTSVQAPGCSSHMDWHGSCPERYNGQSKQFCCPSSNWDSRMQHGIPYIPWQGCPRWHWGDSEEMCRPRCAERWGHCGWQTLTLDYHYILWHYTRATIEIHHRNKKDSKSISSEEYHPLQTCFMFLQ